MKNKFHKIISIVLAIAIVFSVCVQSFTAFAADSPIYYVGSDGDDTKTGLTSDAALKTIEGAINRAIADGIDSAEQVVTVYVKRGDGTAVLFGDSGITLPEHRFTLNILTDPADSTKANIDAQTVTFGGPMTFENIEFSGTSAKTVYLDGNNVRFGKNVKTTAYYRFAMGNSGTTSEITDDINVFFKDTGTISNFCLGYNKAVGAFSGDINIEYDSETVDGKIYMGVVQNSGSYNTTYKGNININVKSTKSKFLLARRTRGAGIKFEEGAAFQIINSSGKPIEYADDNLTHNDIIAAGDYYFITNDSGFKEALQFTDTAGKFSVNTALYNVNAYLLDTDGNRTGDAIPVQDGYLTLTTSGKYEVDVEKVALYETYYVSSTVETSGDGLSEETAVKTVGEAVQNAVASNYATGDFITVKVMGETAEIGVIPQYDFDLNIQSISMSERAVLTFSSGSASDGVLNLANGGDTTYRNVVIQLRVPYSVALLQWSNVVFESDVKFDFHQEVGLAFGTDRLTDNNNIGGQKVVFKSNIPGRMSLSNTLYANITFHDDVTLVLEGDGKPSISLNTYFKDAPSYQTIYAKNLNIMDNNAKVVVLKQLQGATISGKLQVINGTSLDYVDNLRHVDAEKIIINNKTGDKSALDFTETAGKYVVNSDNTLYAFKDGVQVAKSEGGYIDVSAFGDGEYDIIASREKAYTATSTIAAAVEQAIADGYTTRDVITVDVEGETIDLGNLPEYAFDLVVKSDDKATVVVNDTALLANGGKATYKNVEIKYTGSDQISLADQDAKFEKDVVLNIGGKLYIGENTDNVDGQNVEFLTFVDDIVLSNGANKTYTGDLNVILNSDDNTTVYFGDVAGTTYQKNVNLYVENAQSIDFVNNATFSGALQIINSSDNAITASSVNTSADKYIITDKTGIYKAIECTDIAGKYKLNFDTSLYNVTVLSGADVVENAVEGKYITLTQAGEYTVTAELKGTYESYIYKRTSNNGNVSLQNFAAKVNAGEEVNVVYMGGSVTNGSGATERESDSWRAIVGKWLVENFPNAKINNYNRAIGATTSLLGAYRLDHDVIAEKPDLLIIEFSINDWLTKYTYEDARRYFETIVRNTRIALPECDIMTVYTTDKELVKQSKTKADGTPGELHMQAQAHEEIAEVYGMPSIHIGRALLDTLPLDFTQDDWDYYFMDKVHPLDAGYAVYAEVIKEFLADCLFTELKEVKEHTLPEMVSETLSDGNIQYIIPDEEFISNLEEGSGEFEIRYSNHLEHVVPEIRITKDSGALEFKFTGTEISVREFNITPTGQYFKYSIRIDGGEAYEIKFDNTPGYPIMLARDLPYGEHTIEISMAEDSAGSYSEIGNFFVRDQRAESVRTHKFENYVSNNDATCSKLCTETAECEYGCGATDTRDIPDSYAEHKFESYVSDNNATCQKNCTETAECEYGCGATDTRDIPDSYAEHKYENYVGNGDATCQKNETETAECEYGCGETDTRDIPDSTVGHKYTDTSDTTCDFECGYTRQLGAQLIEENGVMYYYENGVKSTATGIVDFEGKKMYINKGRFLGATGLVTVDGKKMYINKGYFLGASGLVTISGKKTYINKGYFTGASGLVTISGKKMYINKGYFTGASGFVTISGKKAYINKGYFTGASGLVTVSGKKMYVNKGYFTGASGLVTISGKKAYINKGYFNTTTAIVKISGKKYYLKKGYAQLSFSGKVKISGKTYTVKKGIVK